MQVSSGWSWLLERAYSFKWQGENTQAKEEVQKGSKVDFCMMNEFADFGGPSIDIAQNYKSF